MVVDDEPDMLALICLEIELANDGLMVAGTARSGEDAVQVVKDARPDVIVLDYLMPGANGLEIAAKLLYADPDLNIVLFSAFITKHTETEAQRVGVRECVSKDRVKELPAILRRYCPTAR